MNDHLNALPQGFMLQEYRIQRVLGSGGFGITYLALDTNLDKEVAIKEYLPNDLAVRQGETTVRAKSTADEDDYKWGLDRFVDEAKTLARFKHSNIVPVLRFFEAHGTAYTIMEYEAGQDLSAVLKTLKDEKPSEAELQALLMPLLDGLEVVHQAGFLHRDIKPGNIIIRDDDVPVLIDFGAARQAMGAKSKSITSIVTPGYAPIEQYSVDGDQGAWSDIYAMGAIIYQAMTGKAPADAPTRVMRDPYVPAIEVGKDFYSENFLKAIDWALQFDMEDRPRSITDWKKALSGGEVPVAKAASPEPAPVLSTPEPASPEPAAPAAPPPEAIAPEQHGAKKSSGGGKNIAAALVLLAVLGGGGWYLYDLDQKHKADEAAWQTAKLAHSIPAYEKYRGQFPKGEKFDQAKSAISLIEIKIAKEKAEKVRKAAALKKADIAAWEGSKKTHTIEAYQKYLAKFANGINATAARKALAELREQEKERKRLAAIERARVEAARLKKEKERARIEAARLKKEKERLERQRLAKNKVERKKFAQEAYRKGFRLKNSRSYDAAIIQFKKSIKLDPTSALAHNQLGNVYFSKRQFNNALRKYNDALRIKPRDKVYLHNRGATYRRLKLYTKALKDYREALRIDPKYVSVLMKRGGLYKTLKRNEQAIRDFKAVIRINPKNDLAHNQLGNIHYSRAKYSQALREYSDAIRLSPKDKYYFYNRGGAYRGLKRFNSALEDYNKALRIDPKYVSALVRRGITYDQMNEYAKAFKDFASALRVKPSYAEAFFRRAMLLNKIKQFSRAIRDFDAAIRNNSKFMSSHFNRGVAYYGLRQFSNAIRDFKEAARLDPRTSSTYNWLGLLHSKIGQNSAATRYYKKSYDLGNRSSSVVRHLKANGIL